MTQQHQQFQPTTIETFKSFKSDSNIGINYDINLNSSNFKEAVEKIVKEYDFDEIIETGTFNGLGSTSIFARTGKYVFTIECNENNFISASKNLSNYQNVCVIHGLSVDRNSLIKNLLNEEFDIDTTYDSKYPKSFYMREVSQRVTVENALDLFCNNERKQLVFLDSAGGVGYFEYLTFMDFKSFNKILMLDDISHIKHKRSVEHLEKLGYIVNKSEDNRFAWCDLSKGKLKKNEDILSEQSAESR